MLRLNDSLVSERNPASAAAESVRSLRVYIRQHLQSAGKDSTVLMLTSANEGEGKTLLVANLAVSFAQEGKRVCVIDANLRKPALHLAFGLNNGGNGLSDYLRGACEAEAAIRPSSIPDLDVITAGAAPWNPAELLSGERTEQLLAHLKQQYEIVLLDSAGVLGCIDARVLASQADGAVLVVRYGRTKRTAVSKAKQYMDQAGVPLLGIAMNQVK
ncbi:hypothetical protein AWM70_00760 [Paenibacillus yonginensis]|uniref:AAA domain-containing protein n=1 Tax=Paenibacillus yonginensis TaxID=1462996 RepID=A0A1B1N6G3_9BACL|nr:CpsD/CapB family tyrosine-protein kinase [Paenibacillus yonginensis]ANS77021.1 hypothetical protein AWM70_00760 [Paenibacillus yonginensis]